MKQDGLRNMNLAIAVLQERLEKLDAEYGEKLQALDADYKRDRGELERAIENLINLPPKAIKGSLAIEVAGWEGMCLTDSIHSLLLRARGEMAFTTMVKALDVAGVRMGDPDKPKRYGANVKTTIINNSDRFRYDKRRDTVRLVKRATQEQYV